MSTTIEDLKSIVAEAMAFDDHDFNETTCLRNIPGYDSVNMLIMLVELEERAGLHIPTDRAGQIKCFGDIVTVAKEQGILD